MRARCNNSKSTNYELWGGRGISVCNEWDTFAGFLIDMQDGYFKGASIDRIDNSKGYYKDNCRWSTRVEQANNTRKTQKSIHITFKGQTKRISEWARELGINRTTLDMRIRHYKMPIEMALTK